MGGKRLGRSAQGIGIEDAEMEGTGPPSLRSYGGQGGVFGGLEPLHRYNRCKH
jgi:hypothetical protein